MISIYSLKMQANQNKPKEKSRLIHKQSRLGVPIIIGNLLTVSSFLKSKIVMINS